MEVIYCNGITAEKVGIVRNTIYNQFMICHLDLLSEVIVMWTGHRRSLDRSNYGQINCVFCTEKEV